MKKSLIIGIVLLSVVFGVYAQGSTDTAKKILDSLNISKLTTETQTSAITAQQTYTTRIDRDMATLTRLYKMVDTNYLYDVDYDAVYDAMAKAMFEALGDPYSEYVLEEDTADFVQQTEGKYGGLGILFSKPDVYCLIEQVYPNTPASRAGLKAKDQITHINGEPVNELEITDCANKMKGKAGEEVTLTILRNNSSFDISIKREIISVPSIEYTMLDNNIGYILILEFHDYTYQNFSQALLELQKEGMEKLIIDVRDCPGGDVDATLSIADLFISNSLLLKESYKNSSKNTERWASKRVTANPLMDVAILINGGSASSAEIFCSTMHDNNRATLIGEKTFGKGIMQAVGSFGKDSYKLTVAGYYPPSGKEIHKVGVEPDIAVEEISVLDEEIDAYTSLYNSSVIKDFVDSHPDYTMENINLFLKENPQKDLRDIIVKIMVRNEYYSRMINDDIPIVDINFDNVLKTAIDYLLSK